MDTRETALQERPRGFAVWLGRIIGAVLILAAIGLALVYFSDGTPSSPNPVRTNQGIRLN